MREAIHLEIKQPSTPTLSIGEIKIVGQAGQADSYDGDYEVMPKLTEQFLATANKLMRNDVKINKIPITSISNSSGGKTVIIGG